MNWKIRFIIHSCLKPPTRYYNQIWYYYRYLGANVWPPCPIGWWLKKNVEPGTVGKSHGKCEISNAKTYIDVFHCKIDAQLFHETIFQWIPSGKHTKSYWTWPFIVDFPIKNGGSVHSYVSLPEGKYGSCNLEFRRDVHLPISWSLNSPWFLGNLGIHSGWNGVPSPWVPSGKRLHNYGKSPFLMGKSTINGHVQ
jgi:hypothetical protein